MRWCELYTRGLDPAVAGDRRAELASDLHEHAAWDAGAGAAMLSRAIRGVPADLAWRYGEQRAAARLLPRSQRVVSGSVRALVLLAASSLLVLGVLAISRTAAFVARGEIRPWSETAMWVIGLTGLAAVGLLLTLRTRTRLLGALSLAGSSALVHVALYDLLTKSATVGALGFTPGWSMAVGLLIAAYVTLFTAAAVLWLPQTTKAHA